MKTLKKGDKLRYKLNCDDKRMFIKTQLKIKKGGVLYFKIVKKTEIQSLGQKQRSILALWLKS